MRGKLERMHTVTWKVEEQTRMWDYQNTKQTARCSLIKVQAQAGYPCSPQPPGLPWLHQHHISFDVDQ